ncbi:pyrimidine nucleotide-sugar transmembrane transporter [Aureococcus anophagefferens]|nr:pyrimidine nucleotide-sugar transmembrane transporter [Aureococcus anophagefferens]
MGEQHPEKARLPTPLVALLLCGFSVLQAMAAAASKEGGEYPTRSSRRRSSPRSSRSRSAPCASRASVGRAGRGRRALYFTTKARGAAVPGVAYQVLNNLNFVTLYYVDAPTFQILGNLKIVATGLAGRYLLKRKLDTGRWLALVLLTLGAASSQVAPDCAGDGAAFLRLGDRAYGYASAVASLGCRRRWASSRRRS